MSQQSRLTVFGAVASVTALFYLEASMDNHCYSPLIHRVKEWSSDKLTSEDYFHILSWVIFSLLFFLNSLMLIVELSEFIYRGGLT